jgi:hypothetical protein
MLGILYKMQTVSHIIAPICFRLILLLIPPIILNEKKINAVLDDHQFALSD